MNCTHCGQSLAPGALVCPWCGVAQPPPAPYRGQQAQASQPPAAPPAGGVYHGQPAYPPAVQPAAPPQDPQPQGYYGGPWGYYPPAPDTATSFVLGIVSVALVFLAFFLALPCSIVGLALSGADRRKGAQYTNIGIGLNIGALVVSALMTIGLAALIVFIFQLSGSSSSYYY